MRRAAVSLRAPLVMALLFLATVIPSNAQKSAAAVGEERVVAVSAGAPLTVECALRVEQRAEWRLDGGAVPGDMRPGGEAPVAGAAGGGLTARLHAAAARAHHAGVYTCARGAGAQRVRVQLQAHTPRDPHDAAATSEAPAGEVDVAGGEGAGGARHVEPLDLSIVYYEVRGNLSLDCSALVTDKAAQLVWRKNNTRLEEIGELKDRYKVTPEGVFSISARSHEDDFGNYTCVAGEAAGAPARGWQVRGRPHAKLQPNTNVVEGQKLKIQCKLVGKPYPSVVWTYSNTSDTVANGSSAEVTAALGERARLQTGDQGVPDTELIIESALRSDAGWYMCAPVVAAEDASAGGSGVPGVTTLRVKDMYAALWPFLGICAEVFVLCAIILVYEKRRTKPELDDSDTDNHDQKKS